MQKRVVLVSAAVAVLGLAAVVLGFVSERAKSKAFVGYNGQRCVYRRTAAFACGIVAALLVLTAMAVATAASGCFGRYGARSAQGSFARSSTAVKLSTIAWVLVVAATVMFLYGAYRNSGGTSGRSRFRSGRPFNRTYYYACADVRGGIFTTASVASAVATACAVAAYVSLHRQDEPGQYGDHPGVAMGQPQWSQPSYPPPQSGSQYADHGVAMGQPQAQWAQPYPAAYPPPAGYPAPPPPHHGYGDGYAGKPPAGTA